MTERTSRGPGPGSHPRAPVSRLISAARSSAVHAEKVTPPRDASRYRLSGPVPATVQRASISQSGNAARNCARSDGCDDSSMGDRLPLGVIPRARPASLASGGPACCAGHATLAYVGLQGTAGQDCTLADVGAPEPPRINPRAAEPPYRQIAAWLRARIMAGEFRPGQDPLPSEKDLQELFEVSRDTARRAVAVL